MSNQSKYLAKRAKRDAKRKQLKKSNGLAKIARNGEFQATMSAAHATKQIKNDVYAFITHVNGFKATLVTLSKGIKDLKAADDVKYSGLIESVYPKAIKSIDEEISPTLSELAKKLDALTNKTVGLSDFFNISTELQGLTVKFAGIVEATNKYHNHNVAIYKGTETNDGLVSVDDSDFDFSSPLTEEEAKTVAADLGIELPKEEPAAEEEPPKEEVVGEEVDEDDVPHITDNIMHDVEADIVIVPEEESTDTVADEGTETKTEG